MQTVTSFLTIRARIAGVALALCSAAMPVHGASQEWLFRVFLGEQEVGEHRFRLEQNAEGTMLKSQARMNVRLLGFNAFSYVHDATERWAGDCLDRIESRTDSNGRPYAVTGERTGDVFRVQTLKATESLPRCIMSFAYWNPKILGQRRLLNPQSGEFVELSVESRGMETIATRGVTMEAKRYTLSGRKLRIDVWYAPDGTWVGLESMTDAGRVLRYVRS